MTDPQELSRRLRGAGPGYQHHMDLIAEAASLINGYVAAAIRSGKQ